MSSSILVFLIVFVLVYFYWRKTSGLLATEDS